MFNTLFNSFSITFKTMKWLYKSCVVFTLVQRARAWAKVCHLMYILKLHLNTVYELSLKLKCFFKLIRIKSSDKPSVQSKDMSFICNPHLLGKPCFPILKFALLKNFIRFCFCLSKYKFIWSSELSLWGAILEIAFMIIDELWYFAQVVGLILPSPSRSDLDSFFLESFWAMRRDL